MESIVVGLFYDELCIYSRNIDNALCLVCQFFMSRIAFITRSLAKTPMSNWTWRLQDNVSRSVVMRLLEQYWTDSFVNHQYELTLNSLFSLLQEQLSFIRHYFISVHKNIVCVFSDYFIEWNFIDVEMTRVIQTNHVLVKKNRWKFRLNNSQMTSHNKTTNRMHRA
jgi:hypothetical protein